MKLVFAHHRNGVTECAYELSPAEREALTVGRLPTLDDYQRASEAEKTRQAGRESEAWVTPASVGAGFFGVLVAFIAGRHADQGGLWAAGACVLGALWLAGRRR